MIVLKTSRARTGQKEAGISATSAMRRSRKGSVSKEESVRLMNSYVQAWDSANAADKKHALPGIERMIIDVFLNSGARLDAETRQLIESVACQEGA